MSGDFHVGPYRILRPLRGSGQGSVYLGYDARLQRRVAVKIYPLSDERARRRRQLREARLVASIQSARVVQIHDVISSPHYLALVMEYVAGIDLEAFLARVKPSLASVLSVGADLAAALAAARQQGVVHGDLKPANVLITPSGRVKLTDFGIARLAGARAGDAGSPSALSPEQYLGGPLDVRCDLFALGCLLYRMLAGFHPFFRGGRLDPQRLLHGEPAPLEQVVPPAVELPAGLAQLVHELLRRDPRDRPANTHQVRQVLRGVAREVPLPAGNPLATEAGPLVGPEAPEAIPPQIPHELGVRGRSQLHPAGAGGPRLWRDLRTPARATLAVGLAVLLLAGGAALAYRWSGATPVRVHIEAPVLQVAAEAGLPAGLSVDWLVHELKRAAGHHLGEMFVSGPLGATPVRTLYAAGRSPAQRPPRERLALMLRCSREFCLLGLSRESGGTRYRGQVMLLPEAPLEDWRAALRGAVDALFAYAPG